jgi:methyltransferase (TIGR00027 family)
MECQLAVFPLALVPAKDKIERAFVLFTMKLDQHSRTAEYMAFFRATESVRPRQKRLFADPFAASFLRPSLQRAVRFSKVPLSAKFVNWYADRRLPGARTSGIALTRLIDDAICDAARQGISQIVILGSGFDCRALRLPELKNVRVFEVDHPHTLAAKLSRLRDACANRPGNVHFAEMDFNREELAGPLTAAGFQSSRPAAFLWEGVTKYLTAEGVEAVLRFVAAPPAGTRLVFTYVDAAVLDGSVHFMAAAKILRDVKRIGEPWTFGLPPHRVRAFLHERGFCLDRDLSAAEYRAEYFGSAARRMKGYEFYHVVTANVREALPAVTCAQRQLSEEKPDA